MKSEEKKEQFYPMREAEFLKKGLFDMIETLQNKIGPLNNKIMVEIGSYIGDSSIIFAQHFGLVICIDPFEDFYDMDDDTCHYAPMKKVEEMFDKQTEPFSNIVKLKMKSDDAAKFAKENNISNVDFVYIDGLHTFEQVKKDIENFVPFLNDPKIIGGHDYHKHWPQVKQAIETTIGIPEHTFCDTSWLKIVKQ